VSGGRGPKAKKGQRAAADLTPRAQRGQRQPPAPTPRARPIADRANGYPSFSFQFADRTHDGSWKWFQDDEAREVMDFLADISRSTWNEIGNQMTGGRNRHRKHHDQPVEGLCKEAQDRLATLQLDEVFGEEIFRFRLSGTRRLWGFVEEAVFYVLWWDADHRVYPTDPL
jgi:hypothetical protein